MTTNKIAKVIALSCLLGVSFSTWACDGAGKSTHVGNLVSVNPGNKSFTIMDAQTRAPITFAANEIIIDGLKDAKGSVMVNYEGEGDQLKAIGVTF